MNLSQSHWLTCWCWYPSQCLVPKCWPESDSWYQMLFNRSYKKLFRRAVLMVQRCMRGSIKIKDCLHGKLLELLVCKGKKVPSPSDQKQFTGKTNPHLIYFQQTKRKSTQNNNGMLKFQISKLKFHFYTCCYVTTGLESSMTLKIWIKALPFSNGVPSGLKER